MFQKCKLFNTNNEKWKMNKNSSRNLKKSQLLFHFVSVIYFDNNHWIVTSSYYRFIHMINIRKYLKETFVIYLMSWRFPSIKSYTGRRITYRGDFHESLKNVYLLTIWRSIKSHSKQGRMKNRINRRQIILRDILRSCLPS